MIWREFLFFLSMMLIVIGIGLITTPEFTCVNGKRYEVTKGMLISTGQECLPIDKD
jgi:dipeptide/tripeptide permease